MVGHSRICLGVASAICLAACSTSPTSPADVIHLAGTVRDTSQHPLADVRVEIVSGQFSGHYTMSSDDGRFQFFDPASVAEPVTLSFLKAGYNASLAPAWRNQPIAVALSAVPKFLAPGDYSFTFTAAAECTALPPGMRTRSYLATLEEPGGSTVAIELRGADFFPRQQTIFGANRGSTWALFTRFDDIEGERLPICERVGASEHLSIVGQAIVPAPEDTARINASFSGTLAYCGSSLQPTTPGAPPRCSVPLLACTSERHQLSVTRR